MTTQHFGHLLERDRSLTSHAERHFVDNANIAPIKTRQVAERMTRLVAWRAGVVSHRLNTFPKALRGIRRDDLLSRGIKAPVLELEGTDGAETPALVAE